jgi:hypothetical protein
MNFPGDIDWRTIGVVLLISYVTTRLHRESRAMHILRKAGAKIGRAKQGARFRATSERARIDKVFLERKLVVTFYEDGIGLGTQSGVDEAFLPFEDLVQVNSLVFPLVYRGPCNEVGMYLGLRVPLPAEIRKE